MAKGRRLPSVMKNRFSTVPSANIRRSSFDRSHGLKTTFNVDYLVPIFVDEVLPGDTFSLTSTHLCRLASPFLAPIMDNLRLDLQFFYVPCRLVFDRFEDFITGGDQPVAWTGENPNENLFIPQAYSPEEGFKENTIHDYMGLPIRVAGSYRYNVLPFRCYNLIWREYFRDQNLQDSEIAPVFTGESDPKVDPNTGEPSTADNAIPFTYKLLKRGKRYDYFTSCLPGLQKGPQVGIGIAGGDSGRLPVHGLALSQSFASNSGYTPPYESNTLPINSVGSIDLNGNTATKVPGYFGVDGPVVTDSTYQGDGNWVSNASIYPYYQGTPVVHTRTSGGTQKTTPVLNSENWPIYVDLSSASSVTINSLRVSITLQAWYEKNARYGSRYIESIQGHFGVHAGDYRVQRPIYLGGSKTYISVNPTVQSSSTTSTSPQGHLVANGLSTNSKRLFTRSFVEHGYIIGLASVTSDLTYQQGLPKLFSRFNRFDFYWPTFAHLGEQPVYNKEIYCQADSKIGAGGVPENDLPFGYQERFAEYRYKSSQICGQFRSNAQNSLHNWHLSQYFSKLPTLNKTFIESTTPIERVLSITDPDYPHILADFFFSLKCARPLPVYSVPGLRRI